MTSVFRSRTLRNAIALLAFVSPVALRGAAPTFQTLVWGAQDVFALPASSHFGAAFALQREGNILLVTAPDGGARSGYVWDTEDGWRDVNWTLAAAGPQFFELAPDLLGVAVTRLEVDATTSIWMHFADGLGSTPVVEGITGFVTAIAKEGSILAVGEAAHAGGAGRVRVFEFDSVSGTFEIAATFNGQAGAHLGASLALDGPLLVAGAPDEGDCGAVRVYARVVTAGGRATAPAGGTWTSLQTIDCPSTTQLDADFGRAVALSGSTLAVGAPLLNRPNPGGGLDFGGVYVFRPDGLLFGLDAFLRPTQTAEEDHFGASLALYPIDDSPGMALLAGAPENDVGGDLDSGRAYLYLDWGDGWRIQREIAMSGLPGVRLGTEVALGRMGVLVGVPGFDGNGVIDQGAVVAWNGIVPLFYDGFDRGDLSAW